MESAIKRILIICGFIILTGVVTPVYAAGNVSPLENITWNATPELSSLFFFTEDYYPFSYRENGTLKGISVDILKEVFSHLNTNLSEDQISLGLWEIGYRKTLNQTGSVIFSTVRNPERENLFLWVGPLFEEKSVIFSSQSDAHPITGPGDLAGMRLGGIRDDISALDLINVGYKDIVYASDAQTLIQSLEEGRIDGWAYAEQPGRDLIRRYAKEPASIQPAYTLNTHPYFFAFNRNTPAPLVQEFQRALDQIQNETDQNGSSTYEQIINRE